MDDDGSTVRSGPYRNGDGRGERGRFAAGNKIASGNPVALKQFRLRREILESAAASPEAIRAAFSRLFRRAIGKTEDKDGASIDIEAMKLYLAYAIGRPTQAIELSLDGGELPDLARIKAAILGALGDDWEVRHRVAKALLAIDRGDDGDGSPRPDGA